MTAQYTSTLNSGLGMEQETKTLLQLWQPGMSNTELLTVALTSGQFPNISARRLRNLIFEGFAPCYLIDDAAPAVLLRQLEAVLSKREFEQLMFLYTCRAHAILGAFVRQVYWQTYASGRESLGNDEARVFVERSVQEGKTTTPWSENTIERVGRYLTRYCADFGLLEQGRKQNRKILTYRIENRVLTIHAYILHFKGYGDNSVLGHEDWELFGMERSDVLDEFRRLALKGFFIVQTAGEATRISWQYETMEELIDALVE